MNNKLRELVDAWRRVANARQARTYDQFDAVTEAFNRCADELSALLAKPVQGAVAFVTETGLAALENGGECRAFSKHRADGMTFETSMKPVPLYPHPAPSVPTPITDEREVKYMSRDYRNGYAQCDRDRDETEVAPPAVSAESRAAIPPILCEAAQEMVAAHPCKTPSPNCHCPTCVMHHAMSATGIPTVHEVPLAGPSAEDEEAALECEAIVAGLEYEKTGVLMALAPQAHEWRNKRIAALRLAARSLRKEPNDGR